MQATSHSLFSLGTLSSLFFARHKSEVAFPDGSSETENGNVGFVRMVKLPSVDKEFQEANMSATQAANRPPPLPPRNSNLPPLPRDRPGNLPPLPPNRPGNLPPLPHNRPVSPATSNTPVTETSPRQPPPPSRRDLPLPDVPRPRRNSDATSEFESRFRFHPQSDLPSPEPFSDGRKTYPSQTIERKRESVRSIPSLPPPPPPR